MMAPTNIRRKPCWTYLTIQETQGRLDNLHVAMVGDLKYGRTVHSLTQALAKFYGNRFYFIAPDALAMPNTFWICSMKKGLHGGCTARIEGMMAEVDILVHDPRAKRASCTCPRRDA
ncbi:hypothetical protein ACLK19_28695 [Escherichia coli]